MGLALATQTQSTAASSASDAQQPTTGPGHGPARQAPLAKLVEEVRFNLHGVVAADVLKLMSASEVVHQGEKYCGVTGQPTQGHLVERAKNLVDHYF